MFWLPTSLDMILVILLCSIYFRALCAPASHPQKIERRISLFCPGAENSSYAADVGKRRFTLLSVKRFSRMRDTLS